MNTAFPALVFLSALCLQPAYAIGERRNLSEAVEREAAEEVGEELRRRHRLEEHVEREAAEEVKDELERRHEIEEHVEREAFDRLEDRDGEFDGKLKRRLDRDR